ncbi:hypothetical protein Ntsu_03760 [Nocardia sp. IFM 10818]
MGLKRAGGIGSNFTACRRNMRAGSRDWRLVQGNSIAGADAGLGSFTVVDVETSGLSSGTDRVLSVAAVALGVDGRVEREFHANNP